MRAILVALALLATTSAGATPAEDKAREHYERGRTKYELAEYPAAIKEFKAAYELSRAPGLLFNIAQSYRLLGDCTQALRFYRTYLRLEPETENRADIEGWVAEMEKCKKPPKEPPKEPPPERPRTEKKSPGRTTRIAGLITGGAGVALLATGVFFGVSSHRDSNRVETGSGTWDADWQAIEDRGKRNEKLAIVFDGVGAAAIVGGVALYMIGQRADARAKLSIAPTPGGLGVSWACDF